MGHAEPPDYAAFLAAGFTEEQARRAANKAVRLAPASAEVEPVSSDTRPTLEDFTRNETGHLEFISAQTASRLATEGAVAGVSEDPDGTIRQVQGHLVDRVEYAQAEQTDPLDFPEWVNQR